MRSITWLCRSWGSRAMALPDRLREGDGADVHGVRDPVAHGDVEGRHRPIGLDDRGRRRRRHVREPRRRGELPQEGRIRLDVHRTPRDPGAHDRDPHGVHRPAGGRGARAARGSPGATAAGGAVDSVGVPIVRAWITGSTVDIQAYTTFLRQLAASPWLTDVTPATSSTIIEADRPVTAFNIAVRYRVADSVYIRTVPFTQPVR